MMPLRIDQFRLDHRSRDGSFAAVSPGGESADPLARLRSLEKIRDQAAMNSRMKLLLVLQDAPLVRTRASLRVATDVPQM